MNRSSRRDILQLLTVGGVVFASGCVGGSPPSATPAKSPNGDAVPPVKPHEDFFFLQMSDTHWGFNGPPNPEADVTLKHAIETINNAPQKPDFVIFTGDLTHTTDDAAVRATRMREFSEIVKGLKVETVRFLPGEHDASQDKGEAYKEHFGDLHYTFDHKGIHFIALDNVSDPTGSLGQAQLAWLAEDLDRVAKETPIVVFAHRPLFDLAPEWEWTTRDGADAITLLSRKPQVTVFYGHIHQNHIHETGAIRHYAARSLIFPQPAPKSVPKRAPLPWDPASGDHGIGFRNVKATPSTYEIDERAVDGHPIPKVATRNEPNAQTTAEAVRLTAR